MTLIIAILLLAPAMTFGQEQTQCNSISNCASCTNYAPQCSDCPAGSVINDDKDECRECTESCVKCSIDGAGTKCDECVDGTYLTASGTCEDCGDGCTDCEDVNGVVTCNTCMETGYVRDEDTAGTPCVECPSNCETCSMQEGTAVCSKCFSYPGLSIQGYFKNSEQSCEKCPSNSNQCTSKETITSCYPGYVVKSDNTRCLTCPTACESCSGEELDGVATCTACKDGLGNFLVDGKCESCTDNCATCKDAGSCDDCEEGYRVDSGSCTECPAKCEECSLDDGDQDVCDTCDDRYGPKAAASITCDSCKESNCQTCVIDDSTGEHSCTICLSGYNKNGDGKCTKCPTGCATCSWETDEGGSYMLCESCASGYGGPFPAVDASTFAAQSECTACTSVDAQCITCTAADPPVCSACGDGYWYDGTNTECAPEDIDNCDSYNADGTCETCANGYKANVGSTACEACTATNCKKCDADLAICSECEVGEELYDSTDDSTDNPDECKDCGISNCDECSTTGDTTKCTSCATKYTVYDKDTQSTVEGTSCKKCPSNCDTCTYNYDGNAALCDDGGCSAGYAYNGDGGCEVCPDQCTSCTYDSGKASCEAGSCNNGFALNENSAECNACPDNCKKCEWDSDSSQVVCTDGECDAGYGLISGGQCGECPDNCVTCSVQDEENSPNLLVCDTCSVGYAKNEMLCAACSSNCKSCEDDEGTMVCEECDETYAVDSTTKECVKCPASCLSCTSDNNKVKCSECMSGFSLSADKASCQACSTAATEFCSLCEDKVSDSVNALCTSCAAGYVLENEKQEGPCIDVSGLQCANQNKVDKPEMCDACRESFFEITDEGKCALNCYQCGDIATSNFVSKEECEIPSGNETGAEFAEVVQCLSGICVWYESSDKKSVMRGCAPLTNEDGSAYTCDEQQEKGCENTDESCEYCCNDDDKCNGSIQITSINLLLIIGAFSLAIFKA